MREVVQCCAWVICRLLACCVHGFVIVVVLLSPGNVRDERLSRTFRANRVRWIREDNHKDEWFNVLGRAGDRVYAPVSLLSS